jgi:hypothetical protein
VLIGTVVGFAQSLAAVPDAAPTLIAPKREASEYYPPASLRSGETGCVVLGFLIDAEGKAIEPFTLDGTSGSSSYRLIVAAERYIRDARFGTGLMMLENSGKFLLRALRISVIDSMEKLDRRYLQNQYGKCGPRGVGFLSLASLLPGAVES